MARKIIFGEEVRRALVQGSKVVSDTVGVTYGPHGRTVMLQRAQGLLSTKDGVTVARELSVEDRLVNMGVQLAKTSSLKVHDEAGDGTTTVVLLTTALLKEAAKLTAGGANVRQVVEGLRFGCALAVSKLEQLSAPIEDQEALEQVLLAATGNDEEIATQVAEASLAVGKDGAIVVEDGFRDGIHLVLKEGMEIPTVMASRLAHETADEGHPLEGPLVAVIDRDLSSYQDIRDVLETATQYPPYSLLVVARRITAEALDTILMNLACNSRIRSVFQFRCLEAPGPPPWKTDHLKDIAALTGATLVDPKAGYDHRNWNPEWYGSARRVEITKATTVLTGYEEHESHVQARVAELKAEIDRCESEYDKDQLQKRLARLVGGLCVLEVGGPTEAALKERRGRLEDALAVARGALEDGVVPGGGTAYLECSEGLRYIVSEAGPLGIGPVHADALKALSVALEEPLRRLGGTALPSQVREAQDDTGWVGWDAVQETIRDLGSFPIVADPLPVAVNALQAAVSIATMVLSSEVAVVKR